MDKALCSMAIPWTDEEGRYDKYLCHKDFKVCDGKCFKHYTIMDEWIREQIDNINNSLINGGDNGI